MAFRRDAFVFYKSALRTAKNWKALDELNTQMERDFLKKTIRREMEAMKSLKTDHERSDQLSKLSNWLDTCLHYKIPYSKPYHFSSGLSMKQARTKFVN